jgi:hypothetical protein
MKKNCVSRVLILIVFILSVIFSGCSESVLDSNTSKINLSGKILSQLNIPVSNAIVKAGDKTTVTSSSGDFSFQDITTPYDLRIIDTTYKKGFIFKNLSRADLNIMFSYLRQDQPITGINITIPHGIFTSGGKAIFTDGNQISYYNDIDSNGSSIVTYPGNNSSITGKVILIFFTKNNSGNIISYDRYGEKDNITINSGVTKNVDFTLNDLQLDPGEVTVSGNFSGFQNNSSFKFFYLSFGKRKSSGYSTNLHFSDIYTENFNLVLPTNLPSDYTPLIYANDFNSNGFIVQQFALPKSGTGIILSPPSESPTLINPPDNATGIDTTTLFEWTTGTGNGIYSIVITNPTNTEEYRIYTNSTSTTLADLNSIGLVNFSNRIFSWSCEKNGSVNSLDEYLDPAGNNLGYFKALTSTRVFSTK